jgi:hypothetical protein
MFTKAIFALAVIVGAHFRRLGCEPAAQYRS